MGLKLSTPRPRVARSTIWASQVPMFSFSLHRYSAVELLNHVVVLFLILWGTSIHFLSGSPIYIPTNRLWEFSFFHIVANTNFLSLDNSHSDRCEVVSHCSFDLQSPDDSDVEYLFRYLLPTCMSLLEKCLDPLPIFLIRVFRFLKVSIEPVWGPHPWPWDQDLSWGQESDA